MAERVLDPRIKVLYDRGISPYSFSRLESINNCLYMAYNTYKLHNRGEDNIYSSLGSRIHSCIQDITEGKATEADLLPAMQSELEDMEFRGFEFPKDFRGENSIRDGWVADMTHFCTTYKNPVGKFKTEELFIYKSPKGRYLIGYIDLQRINKDGTISIYDYKTSSMYHGDDVISHRRQLIIYGLGLEQAGYKVRNVSWIFLKFCEIRFEGYKTAKSKNKTAISKVIERKKIGSEMARYVEADLLEAGYDAIETEMYLYEFKNTNKFDCLPEEVRDKYRMIPYVWTFELTDDFKSECEEYIDNTIDMWESTTEFPPRSFKKEQKSGKVVDDTFFCIYLCSFRKTCRYIHDYLDSKQDDNWEDNLF